MHGLKKAYKVYVKNCPGVLQGKMEWKTTILLFLDRLWFGPNTLPNYLERYKGGICPVLSPHIDN